jgi:hypothetical protein
MARDGYDHAITVLERLVPVARAINHGVLGFAIATGFAALMILASVLAVDVPSEWWTWLLLLVLAGLLLTPAVILTMFFFMLREALALPAKLRQLPDVAPDRASELAQLVSEARARERTVSVGSLPRDSWRAGRLLLKVRDDIPWAGVLISLVRVPFLIAVAAAFLFGLGEIVMAPVVAVVALLFT